MNVLFISHCDFQGNSAMHIFSIANTLSDLGVSCAVCVPNDPHTVEAHGTAAFAVVPYAKAAEHGVRFPDGRAPDLIHAWTPRELVRKLTERLADTHSCPYVVHLEDNEEFILACEGIRSNGAADAMGRGSDVAFPDHRSHPVRSKHFIDGASAVTAVIDRLLEFKPADTPGLVFWPGFDEEFRNPPAPSTALLNLVQPRAGEKFIVYTGNIHDVNIGEVTSLFLSVQALRRRGVPVRLLRSGWTHSMKTGLLQEAIEAGAVTELGFLPRHEIPALLSLADVLVQPGRCDEFNEYRFPSKLPEFLVSGKPVILPRANIGRFLTGGEEAVLLRSGDALEIAETVENLLQDPRKRRQLGEAGRDFAIRRLSWTGNVPPVLDLYKQVLAPRSPSTAVATAPQAGDLPVKLISFYLPQFHPIEENDRSWGKGFTEWTNVVRAQPLFTGHYQPQLPADLGFYDLRALEVLKDQAELAARYGIYGFCFYYYWFNGRRLLDIPLNRMLRAGQPDFPFCICWANENWTRSWDGSLDEILVPQDYANDACERFIYDVIPILKDPRYIRVHGAPVLLVYRVDLIPDVALVTERWREICASEGIPSLHLCAVQSFSIKDPRIHGFDAAVEFPPHVTRALVNLSSLPGLRTDFKGYIEDYAAIARNQADLPQPDYLLYRGVMPAWDNTPRRGANAHVLVNSSPELYEEWLYQLAKQALHRRGAQEPLLFINAWNEWAEGAYLEPDQVFGHQRLIATRRAVERAVQSSPGHAIAAPHPAGKEQPAVARTLRQTDTARYGQSLLQRYGEYPAGGLSYATVRDYCDSCEHLNALATANGDLKDCQRPWTVKAILAKSPPPGRILEIGAGKPLVADMLYKLGYEVWIVDPYDGSGNGPREFAAFRKRYPYLRFVRSEFHDRLSELREGQFDCIYSISVLEHIQNKDLPGLFRGIRRYLSSSGVSVHAIDHVHRGNGAAEHLEKLRKMIHGFGLSQAELDGLLERMSSDTETCYLSAEGHNRWRNGVAYDEFPMRVCVSIQVVSSRMGIRAPELKGSGKP